MPKRLLPFFQKPAVLAMALLLFLTSCAPPPKAHPLPPPDTAFSARPYEAPQAEELRPILEEFEAACRRPGQERRVERLYGAILDSYDRIATMSTLAQIRYDQNTADAAAQEEQERTILLYQQMAEEATASLQLGLQSSYRPLLEKKLGDHTEWIEASTARSDEEIALSQQEISLQNDYTAAASGDFAVQVGGREWSYELAGQADGLSSEELAQVYRALEQEENRILGNDYLELVSLRHRQASLAGYDNYVDYAYESVYERDFLPQDVRRLSSLVLETILPLRNSFGDDERDVRAQRELVPAQTRTQEEILATVGPSIARLSPELGQIFDRLRSRGLVDLTLAQSGSPRAPGGYTVALPSYRDAFIFCTADGDYQDDLTLIHEFGHFSAYCMQPVPELLQSFRVDVGEIQSQALELLILPYAEDLFGEAAESIRYYQVRMMLEAVLMGCLINEFENAVYTGPEMTLDEMNRLFFELQERYQFYFSDDYDGLCYSWVEIPHLFSSPCYYIGYSTSALSALDLWALSHNDQELTTRLYLNLLRHGGDYTYREAVRALGLRDIFDRGQMEALVSGLADAARKDGLLSESGSGS